MNERKQIVYSIIMLALSPLLYNYLYEYSYLMYIAAFDTPC